MTNFKGLISLAKGIVANRHLLYLSLSNCSLDINAGKELRHVVQTNDVIIHIGLTNNPNLGLYDVRYIQDRLNANKKIYDKIRLDKFLERKRMKREEQISSII